MFSLFRFKIVKSATLYLSNLIEAAVNAPENLDPVRTVRGKFAEILSTDGRKIFASAAYFSNNVIILQFSRA